MGFLHISWTLHEELLFWIGVKLAPRICVIRYSKGCTGKPVKAKPQKSLDLSVNRCNRGIFERLMGSKMENMSLSLSYPHEYDHHVDIMMLNHQLIHSSFFLFSGYCLHFNIMITSWPKEKRSWNSSLHWSLWPFVRWADGPMGQVAHKNGCRTAEPTESCRFVGPLRSTVASQLQTANFATWGPFQLQRFDWN